MTDNPLVSIIVRTKDRPKLLKRALESISAQTYRPIEVVLVNDGGCNLDVDEIKGILGEVSLNYIRLEKNTGRAHAGNVGIENAKGEYIGFLDDDDEFYPEHVQTLITFLKQSDYKVAYADTEMLFMEFSPNEGKMVVTNKFLWSKDFSYSNLLIGNYIPFNSIIFSKDALLSSRLDENYELYEDWDLLIQIGQRYPFYHIKKITAVYYQWSKDLQTNQASANHMRALHLKIINKYREKITPDDILNIKYEKERFENNLYQLQETVKEKDRLIAEMQETVKEKDRLIAEMQETVKEKDRLIAEMQETVNLMRDTLGWKILEKLRRTREKVLPQGSKRRRIYDLGINSIKKKRFPFLGNKGNKNYEKSQFKIRNLFLILWEAKKNPALVKKFIFLLRLHGFQIAKQRLIDYCESTNIITGKSPNPIQSELQITCPFVRSDSMETHRHPITNFEDYDYVFLDVFDTSIFRLFLKPTDIFRYISFKKNNGDFYKKRIERESFARRLDPSRRDITIFNIYNGFGNNTPDEEIEEEFRFCVANPEILKFYRELKKAGKKVFFLSDNYLDKTVIAKILDNNGYLQYEGLFVSSNDDLIKGDGSRYKWLKQSFPDTVGKSIMIGDNIIADYEQPKSQGYNAFHYTRSYNFYKSDRFINTKIDFLNSKNGLGLSFILSMYRYWKLGLEENSTSYWRQFGFLYGGALVSSFCQFVHNHILKEGLSCQQIYFMGRDGHIMNQVYQLLFNNKSKIKSINLMVSRRSTVFPALTSLKSNEDHKELIQFIIPFNIRGAKDILKRLGYLDLRDLESDLNSLGLDPSRWSQHHIQKCLERNWDKLIEKIESERETLYRYLKSCKVFDESQLVLVDVGWGGSIQHALTKLFEIWEITNIDIYGIYVGVNSNAPPQLRMKGYLFDRNDKGENDLNDYKNLIELIFSSPVEPIERIEYINGDFVPVNNGVTIYEKKRLAVSKEIQKGVLDFATIIKEREIDLEFITPGDFKALFDSLKNFPTIEDLRQIGQIKHSLTRGSDYSLPVLNFKNNIAKVRSDIKIITVFITKDLYEEFFTNNFHINGYELIGIDNRNLNLGLSKHYNNIIAELLDEDCWLFFCHEDFKIMDDLSIIDTLDHEFIYGTFGVIKNKEGIPIGYGKHICSNKDGTNPTIVGIDIKKPVSVETLDCQSILIHTSLLRKLPGLRFDENLTFDLYVEDFCINARENFKVDIKVFPLRFQHFSHGKTTQRYYDGLAYLARKYPNVGVAGSCSFIGGRAEILEKFFKYDIQANREFFKANDRNQSI